MTATLLHLAALFGLLSVLSVGGAAGVIPEMQHAAVSVYHWMTAAQFLAMFAISRAAPGPGSLIVVLIGHQAAGWPGAAVSALAMFVPSSILAYLAARFWRRGDGPPGWRGWVERALAPIAVGLTIASGLALIRGTEHSPAAFAVTLVTTLVLALTELSPFVMLATGAVVLLATALH